MKGVINDHSFPVLDRSNQSTISKLDLGRFVGQLLMVKPFPRALSDGMRHMGFPSCGFTICVKDSSGGCHVGWAMFKGKACGGLTWVEYLVTHIVSSRSIFYELPQFY